MKIADVALTIDGRGESGETSIAVIDPATGRPFSLAPLASRDQLDRAMRAAVNAFSGWAAMPTQARRSLILSLARLLRSEVGSISTLLMREQGKPLSRAQAEVLNAANYVEALCKLDPDTQEARGPSAVLHYRPLGPALCITAWNFPLLLAIWKIVPALLAGNSVILKPSPLTPLSTLRLGMLAQDLFPPGVLNVVVCADADMPLLTTDPRLPKISFTGSAQTGAKIMAAGAASFKRLTLELGGSDAGIVLDDVDAEQIAESLFWARFHNSGQLCAALKRLFVHETVHDAVAQALVRIAARVRVGPGDDPQSHLGPLQTAQQCVLLARIVDDAINRGARLIYQGDVPKSDGHYFPVTLLTHVPPDAEVMRTEIFGPVLPITAFSSVESAIKMANSLPFGLGGSVWSSDSVRAERIARQLDVGTAWINQHPAIGPDIPFGGAKSSGLGVEFGIEGLRNFMQLTVVRSDAADLHQLSSK